MAAETHPTRAAIAQFQLEQLRALLRAILPANPFQSRKLRDAQLTSDLASLEEFSQRCPFTLKSELAADQLAAPPFGTNLTFPVARYTRFHQTSGTAGAPLRWLDTPESWAWMVGSWTEILRAADVRSGDRVYLAFSFGPFIGFWLAFEAAQNLGCLCIPGGGLGSAQRLRAILDNEATVLCCTPTYAARLAEVAASEKIDLAKSRVRKILVAGEPGGSVSAVRERLENLWPGARVFDHHGMTEVGPVTFECPARAGRLHVLDRAYFAEVIDPANARATAPGETGELILTPLGREGSPLLRYRTGDLVRLAAHHGSRCECGRFDTAFDGGILGRSDDMIIVRGVNLFPSAVDEIIRRCGGIAEYQVVVTTHRAMNELRVRIEPSSADAATVPALEQRLEKLLQESFSLRIPVEPAATGTLPRFEMKARRWVRNGG
jgi:phenylacetate-CoA ligase